MRKIKNSRGFTIAELAASLGVFALAATILTPAFTGATANGETMVTVSEESAAAVSPFTPPVDRILVEVKDATTGELVRDPVAVDAGANSATITGLAGDKDYTFEVVKENQAGQSPAAVAKVVYSKVGERDEGRTRTEIVDDTSRPQWGINHNDPIMGDGTPIMGNDSSRPTAWAKKVIGYNKKTIYVPTFIQGVAERRERQVAKTRQVRVAPFSWSICKSRQVRVAPFTRSVSCGTESYTYTGTCSRSRSVACGSESYSYSCTKTRSESYRCGSTSYRYSCGSSCSGYGRNRRCSTRYCTGYNPRYCSRTVSYSSTCTGSRTKYCTVNENYSCTKTGSRTKYCDQAVYNYRTENYTETETVYNYKTETYYETEEYVHRYNMAPQEGTCADAFSGSWTGVTYSCTAGSNKAKSVDDKSSPIYGDDTSKPIAWAQKVVGYKKDRVVGYRNTKLLGYEKKSVVVPYTVKVPVMKGITAQKAVSARPGQLLLDASTVSTVNRNWKQATVAASGSATRSVGSTVKFTRGQLVTLNGKQYIAVPAAATK